MSQNDTINIAPQCVQTNLYMRIVIYIIIFISLELETSEHFAGMFVYVDMFVVVLGICMYD